MNCRSNERNQNSKWSKKIVASDGGFETNGNCTGTKHQTSIGKEDGFYRGPKDLMPDCRWAGVPVEAYLVRDEVVQINDITHDLPHRRNELKADLMRVMNLLRKSVL